MTGIEDQAAAADDPRPVGHPDSPQYAELPFDAWAQISGYYREQIDADQRTAEQELAAVQAEHPDRDPGWQADVAEARRADRDLAHQAGYTRADLQDLDPVRQREIADMHAEPELEAG